jgi:hypothetical protein
MKPNIAAAITITYAIELMEKSKKIIESVRPVRKQYNTKVASARLSGILLIKAVIPTIAKNCTINNP